MFKKALAFTLFLITVLFCLFSCAHKEKDFLSYQNYSFSTDATLDVNGEKYGINISRSDKSEYKLSFLSPDTMNGVSITKSNGKLTYSVGSVHIPIKSNTNITAESLRLFELQKSDLVSTESTLIGGVNVDKKVFKSEYGSVKLYLSAETGNPVLIDADINGNPVKMYVSRFDTPQK